MEPDSVYGVDFSGARNAERNIWLAGGPLEGGELHVETLGQAKDVLDGDPSGREATHEAFVAWLREREPAAVGLDFSFGVPALLAEAVTSGPADWTVFLDAFPSDDCPDADAFEDWGKALTHEHTSGERAFLKRETDGPVGASSPYGFIGSTITYYGVRDVLAPLVLGSDGGEAVATVAPMQTAAFEPPLTLLETYPAGALDRSGLQRDSYKGASATERAHRRENLDGLVESTGVSVTSEQRETVIENTGGDALDAVVAAAATLRAVESEFAVDTERYDEREGYIYV